MLHLKAISIDSSAWIADKFNHRLYGVHFQY